MTHTFAFRRSHTSDVTHNWLGNVLLDVRRCFFFSATADLTDHHDRFGLRIFFEHFEDVDKVRTRDRVAADTDTGRLTETVIRGLFNRFIGQRTGTGNDTHFTRFVNVTRLDTDFAFPRGDNAWAVRADHTNACFIQFHFHRQHIQRRDAFSDGDNQFDACIDSFQNGVFAERCWYVDNRGGSASSSNSFTHGVEHRQAEVGSTAFTWGYAANHFSAVCNGLL
ncbi:hypothetical protein HmCmsJML164_01697 [Escherichia coli]|nr:hypothetical protein HmCmsJML164_01697 [Escherichia coli]